jgi:glycosyl transferase, family 25
VTPQLVRDASAPAAERALKFLNEWADRVFVISLPRAEDRRARVHERLRGLEYAFWDGVDKHGLDRAALLRDRVLDESGVRRAFRHGRAMLLGEVGAALAHRQLCEEIVRRGWQRTVIFEDDVVPRLADLGALPAALAQLPDDFELCYLGYEKGERTTAWDRVKQAAYVALGPLRVVPWTAGEARRLHPRPFAPNLRRAGLHRCAHAYAVSLAGAQKIVSTQTPVAFRADWVFPFLILNGRMNAFLSEPKLFDQETAATRPAGAPPSYIHG